MILIVNDSGTASTNRNPTFTCYLFLLLHKEKHDLVLDTILPFLLEQIQAAETTWGEELDEQDECLWQIECKLRQQLSACRNADEFHKLQEQLQGISLLRVEIAQHFEDTDDE